MRTLLLSLLAACTGAEPPAPAGLTPMPLPARLATEGGAAALLVAPAEPPAPESVARFGFDTGLPEGWTTTYEERARAQEGVVGVTTVDPAEGAGALSLSMAPGERRDMPTVSGVVPVGGGEDLRVRFQLRARGLDPGIGPMTGGGIVVEELGGMLQEDVLAVHDDLPRVLGDTDWTAGSVGLRTRPGTQALRITLSAGPSLVGGAADFDELVVERLGPDAAARAGAPLSPTAHTLSREVTVDGDTRPALLAPDATVWGMAVERATPVEVRAGFARLPASDPDVRICYELAHAGEAVLASGCIEHGDDQYAEIAESLPAGPVAELQLRSWTEPPGGGATGAWGAPRVWPRARAAGDTRPDIVLFIVDTLAADHTGIGGRAERPTTPTLDAFAARNIRYLDATTPAGWTEPSMGSLVTGVLPSTHRAGYRRERIYRPISRKSSEQKSRLLTYRPLSSRVQTLAERLRDAGYLTQGVYTNAFFGNAFGFARGYDRYDKYAGKRLAGGKEGFDRAIAWWESLPPRDQRPPAFLMMHVVDPHDPYRIRVPAVDGFEPPPDIPGEEGRQGITRYVEARPQDAEAREFPDQLAVYYQAEIRYLDDEVGRFLEAVEQPGTAMLLVSDHGEAFAEHDRFIHGRTIHHEEVHVPLVLRRPDGAGAGSAVEAPVSTVAVTPTLLSFAGIEAEGLWAPLPAPDAAIAEHDIISEAMLMGRDRTALRRGDWRYLLRHPVGIRGPARKRAGGHAYPPSATRPIEHLYQVSVDHDELDDKAATEPEVLADMRARAHAHLRAHELGVHFDCAAGEPQALRIQPDNPVSRFVPFAWTDADKVEVTSDRSAVSAQLSGQTPAWGVVYTPKVPATLRVEDGAGQVLFDGEPPDRPDRAAPLLGGRCRVWRVGQPGDDASANLDDGDVQALQALGYID
jgi:arylsulfatase A-like enzyme